MSWKSRATSGPPKKSLAYLDQDTRLHRDAIRWLQANGHVTFDTKERRYVATKEST